MLQPILTKDYAQNLMLIIENQQIQIPSHLKWLIPNQFQLAQEPRELEKKPEITEEFNEDIEAQEFIKQRIKVY